MNDAINDSNAHDDSDYDEESGEEKSQWLTAE